MATSAALLTIDEYLHTQYEHNPDSVDGIIEEKGLPTPPHSRLQYAFQRLLAKYEEAYGLFIYPE